MGFKILVFVSESDDSIALLPKEGDFFIHSFQNIKIFLNVRHCLRH